MTWQEINKHKDHIIEFHVYAGGESYCIECCECGEILVDFEQPPEIDVEKKLSVAEIPEDWWDETVIEHCMQDASEINNGGFAAQLAFLLQRGEDIEKLIEEANDEAVRQERVREEAGGGDGGP